jgi:hypothetical protein
MVSSLTGSGIVNLSYWRFSFIDNAFLCHRLWTNLWGRSYWTYLNSSWFFAVCLLFFLHCKPDFPG